MPQDHRQPIPGRFSPTIAQRRSLRWLAGDDLRNPAVPAWRWFLINPCCNFLSVVVGISHLARTVNYARGDGWTFVDGFNWGYSVADGCTRKRRFLSYRGRFFECMIGTKTSGAVGMSFRIANATQKH